MVAGNRDLIRKAINIIPLLNPVIEVSPSTTSEFFPTDHFCHAIAFSWVC